MCWLQFSLDEDGPENKVQGFRAASQQRLREFTLDMDTGAATQRVVSDSFGDFPSIPRYLAGWQLQHLLSFFFSFVLAGKDLHHTNATIATLRACDVHYEPYSQSKQYSSSDANMLF